MLKFRFNKKAFENMAKELRRASWGAATAAGAVGVHLNSGVSLLLGASAWSILQVLAFVLESLRTDNTH